MLKFIIVQLCDSSVSFCHYKAKDKSNLISLKNLENGLLWAIKHSLDIQVLYPKYQLPEEYSVLLNQFPYVKIANEGLPDTDIIVLDGWDSILRLETHIKQPVLLHSTYREFIIHQQQLGENLHKFSRLNIVFTDVHLFSDSDKSEYDNALSGLCDSIRNLYANKRIVQLNIITDRMMLSNMNNCNAGNETITLAPDGKFYPCAAFYLDKFNDIGNPVDGLNIANSRLYKLEYAPLCRICDAYHCKRCIWLNKKLTLEVNVPSHQQCVMSHIERKASKRLLESIREFGDFAPDVVIPDIDYSDPFEKTKKI